MNAPVHSLIVSHLFWPRFKKQSLKLPGQLGRLAKQYEKAFTKLKPEKRLEWLPALGSVSLEVVLKDRTLELEVTPLQAAVLEMFDARRKFSHDQFVRIRRLTLTFTVLFRFNSHAQIARYQTNPSRTGH